MKRTQTRLGRNRTEIEYDTTIIAADEPEPKSVYKILIAQLDQALHGMAKFTFAMPPKPEGSTYEEVDELEDEADQPSL